VKKILYFTIGLIVIFFSNTFLNDLNLFIFNIKPNLTLIYLVYISIYIGADKASLIGLLLGLVIDISVGKYFAYYSLIFFLIGFFCGNLKEKVFKENIFTILLLILISSFIDNLLSIIITGFSISNIGVYFLRLSEGVIINGMISALLFYPLNMILIKVDEQW